MNRNDLDRELTRLQEASQRIAANLVELEIDSSRQLLEASALTGASAARWAAANAALTDLWAWRALLDALLERAEKLRHRTRHLDELRALLDGPSIELTRAPVPLAERDLLGSAEVTTRCTPGELIARMSSAFDQAKNAVAEFAEAWNTLTPRITSAHAALEQSRALAAQLGESERSDLTEAANRIQSLRTACAADPLSVKPGQLDRLTTDLEAIRRELEESTKLRGALDARLADARARLANLTTVVQEARTAHEELAVKVAVPTAPPPPELADDPGAELDQIERLARSGAWHEARRQLERWTSRTAALLEDAQRILRANLAPLEARSQLRGLLEAYRIKAARLHAIEDPELARIYAEAHDALYTAPTDLARVAQLVRRYQEILSAAPPAREAVR
jgi:chromosome segregation ATPase